MIPILRNPNIHYLKLVPALNKINSINATHGKKGKMHPCTGTEALYRSYGPQAE